MVTCRLFSAGFLFLMDSQQHSIFNGARIAIKIQLS